MAFPFSHHLGMARPGRLLECVEKGLIVGPLGIVIAPHALRHILGHGSQRESARGLPFRSSADTVRHHGEKRHALPAQRQIIRGRETGIVYVNLFPQRADQEMVLIHLSHHAGVSQTVYIDFLIQRFASRHRIAPGMR